MKNFTPEDLKKQWPNKYDLWKFIQKNNGEWYGCYKNQGGTITGNVDASGNEIPVLEAHELAQTGQFGGGIWIKSIRNTLESKKTPEK